MLKALLLLIIGSSVNGDESEDCHACLYGRCYLRRSLTPTMTMESQLAVDRTSNTAFFHFVVGRTSYSAALDITKGTAMFLEGYDYAYARAVNQNNEDLYLFSNGSLYIHNKDGMKQTIPFKFGSTNVTVKRLQYKEKLYFTAEGATGIFTYENRGGVHLYRTVYGTEFSKIEDFIIDKDNDVYFVSYHKVQRLTKGDIKPVLAEGRAKYALTTNSNDEAFILCVSNKTLYAIDYGNHKKVVEMGAIGFGVAHDFAFDKSNNIIYYDIHHKKIFQLNAVEKDCVTVPAKLGNHVEIIIKYEDSYSNNNVWVEVNKTTVDSKTITEPSRFQPDIDASI